MRVRASVSACVRGRASVCVCFFTQYILCFRTMAAV